MKKKYWIGLAKLLNGQDVATIYTEHPDDENLWVFCYPMEVYFHDRQYNSEDFELIDWIPANQEKDIFVRKDMIFSINLIREDIEEVYNKFLDTVVISETKEKVKDSQKLTDGNIINIFNRP